MNHQIPLFMPMYPRNFEEEIRILQKKIENLEERIVELEKTKIIKLETQKKDKDSFKSGYML